MEFAEAKVSTSFDDERGKKCVYVELGHWKATGFYHEGGLMLDEDAVSDLIRDLVKAKREL